MEKWSERSIQLANGVTQQVQLKSPTSNLVLVRNFDATNFVYMSTKPNISNSNYDNFVDVLGWGVISKLGILDSVYLLAEADMSVLFVEATVKDPEQFVTSMIRSKATPMSVNVLSSILPIGAASAANQLDIKTIIDTISQVLATEAKQDSLLTAAGDVEAEIVSLAGIAATAAKQDSLLTAAGDVEAEISALAGIAATETTLENVVSRLESVLAKLDSGILTTLNGSKVSVIYGAFAVGTSAVSKAINGKECTVNVLSGTVWINPLDVAVADATAIKLTGAIDLVVDENLSLISDATGASVQIIVWE